MEPHAKKLLGVTSPPGTGTPLGKGPSHLPSVKRCSSSSGRETTQPSSLSAFPQQRRLAAALWETAVPRLGGGYGSGIHTNIPNTGNQYSVAGPHLFS